jgi:metal-sulfur cluster biosynthetic enzyme
MSQPLSNEAPIIHETDFRRSRPLSHTDLDDKFEDPLDAEEIFQLIRDINDPEHPLTLEQLHVVQPHHIYIQHHPLPIVRVAFTPTIPHCSMATLIGLCIRVKLSRSLPNYHKIDVYIRSGTHQSEDSINRQLNDKERVCAATENSHLLAMVNQCLSIKHASC